MNRKELDRELDEWLDRTATDYGKAEMRPGFEHRIITKLRNEPERKAWRFPWIPVAAAVAVLLCFSAYLLRNQFQNQGITEVAIERHSGSATVPSANAGFVGNHAGSLLVSKLNSPILESTTKRSVRRQAVPKAMETLGGRFLSSGLSDQERYLIAFVREKSKEKSQDIPDKNIFEPLQIPAFQIESFEISSFEIDALPTMFPGSEEEL
jgi:hypothetical protein